MEFLSKSVKASFIFCLVLMLYACHTNREQKVVQRYASITGLRADKIEEYKKLHANAWPAVLGRIKESNIQNYSIYLKQIGEEYFLFSYFEYVGNDFENDMYKMAADPETQGWWKETDPCQIALPDARAKGEIWSDMEEVFHTD